MNEDCFVVFDGEDWDFIDVFFILGEIVMCGEEFIFVMYGDGIIELLEMYWEYLDGISVVEFF